MKANETKKRGLSALNSLCSKDYSTFVIQSILTYKQSKQHSI